MKNESELFSTIFKDKPALLLAELYKSRNGDDLYGSTIAKKIDCTYSHVVKILQIVEGYDLVEFNRSGRLKLVNLTDKGEEIAKKIEEIRTMLN